MTTLNRKRLIEESLPLRQISAEAAKEKSIRHGHISGIHAWWARRPLIACRAAALGSLIEDPGDTAKRKPLLDLVSKYCTWEASDDLSLRDEAHRLIVGSNGGRVPRVLDCFAGGASIPLELTRLGCETHSLDLNPVAVLIETCVLVYPQRYGKPFGIQSPQEGLDEDQSMVTNRLAYDVKRWGELLLKDVQKELAKFYPDEQDGAIPVATIWARTVKCPNPSCGASIPLLRQLWLARKTKKEVALRILPNHRTKDIRFEIVEGKAIDFDPSVGTLKLGTVECPVCKQAVKGSYIREEAIAKRMGQRPICVISAREGDQGKRYRVCDERDLHAYNLAKKECERILLAHPNLLPAEPIHRPSSTLTDSPLGAFYVHLQVVNYGFLKWGDVFNARQALSLITFAGRIRETYKQILSECGDPEYAKAVTTYLAFALDRLASFNNTFCVLNETGGRGVVWAFGRQALSMVWDYAETNPFNGLGANWIGGIESIADVIKVFSIGNEAMVRQGTATQLPYPSEYFDAVITDPPYYDAVPYADLSDFFYVWLKRTIGDLYPKLFLTSLTPKDQEIIQDSSLLRRATLVGETDPSKTGVKDKTFFEREMTKAFVEINRVLKPEGILTVVFAHKTIDAWESLILSLLNSGFTVTASWPIHTERPGRLRAQESAALASSVWLVCRKRKPNAGTGAWKSVQAELDTTIRNRLDFYLDQGIKGADALLSAIGPALEDFGRYSKVEKVTGEPVSIGEFLDKVREVVAHHALASILLEHGIGNVDSVTAFYVFWKWTYEAPLSAEESLQTGEPDSGEPDEAKANLDKMLIPYDESLKLARSVGADPDILLRLRLLEQKKEYVRLRSPLERKDIKWLGEVSKDGTPPPIIDMIHRALILWVGHESGKLDTYLKDSGAMSNQAFRRVAQALSDLLPVESKEKQLLDGLLASESGRGWGAKEGLASNTLDRYTEGGAAV